MAMKKDVKKAPVIAPKAKFEPGKKVVFSLEAPGANKVMLVGDFNNWDDSSTPLRKVKSSKWERELQLTSGRYEYKFVVDGNWVNDPKNSATVWNTFGTQNSVLEVL